MFDLFDINYDGKVDGMDFMILDSILFPPEEDRRPPYMDDESDSDSED